MGISIYMLFIDNFSSLRNLYDNFRFDKITQTSIFIEIFS